jgi:glutaminyl-peptide cyclotransferase
MNSELSPHKRTQLRFPKPLLWIMLCLVIVGFDPFLSCTPSEVTSDEDTASAEKVNTDDFDSAHAYAYLSKQCEFGPRFPGSTAHKETQAYLLTELQKFAQEVELQPFEFRQGNQQIQMNNILAQFGPDSGEKILLAAHWDTRPFADQDATIANRNQPILGANDGASGVAVLLEVARVLKAKPPPRPVIIVLFDGEDYGRSVDNMFLGSRHFAQNMGRWRPDYGILLDMIGDRNLELPMERYSWSNHRDLTEAIWARAKKLGLSAFQDRIGYAIMDDHLPLIEAGVPMVDIIDFDYPYWHTLEDTPDKCSAESLGVVGKLVLSIIYSGL